LTPKHAGDPAGAVWETRELMMMAMLHDQDLGSFAGEGNAEVISRLRACRNKLIPWRPDMKFLGYWENGDVVNTGNPKLLASLYTCPRGTLLLFGNVSKDNIEAAVAVDWKKLGIDLKESVLADAEEPRQSLRVSPDGKITLIVPERGLRLISVTPRAAKQ